MDSIANLTLGKPIKPLDRNPAEVSPEILEIVRELKANRTVVRAFRDGDGWPPPLSELMKQILEVATDQTYMAPSSYTRPANTQANDPLVSARIHWIRQKLRVLTRDQKRRQIWLRQRHTVDTPRHMTVVRQNAVQITWLHREWRLHLGQPACHLRPATLVYPGTETPWCCVELSQKLMKIPPRRVPQKGAP